MKIAFILGNPKTNPENYYLFLSEYIKNLNQNYEIELYSNDNQLLSDFKAPNNLNLINYNYNLKTMIEKKYDLIHNFGDEKFALIAPFICRHKVINTLSQCPFNKEILGTFPKTINISDSKDIYEQNKFYFDTYISISFLGKNDLNKIIQEYDNIYRNRLEKPEVSEIKSKLNIVMYARGCCQFNGDTPFIKALGGTESSIVYISRELAKAGHQVTVFSNCVTTKYFEGVFYDFPENYDQYCKENNIDVLIISRDSSIKNKLNAKISIFWAHEDFNQSFTINFFENTSNGEILDKIFVISNYQKENYIKHFNIPENKFYLSRNGINPEFYKNTKNRKPYKLMYTSAPHRGLELLVKIFPKIKEKIPDAFLEIYSSIKIYGYTEEFDNEYYGEIYDLLNRTEGVSRKELISHVELAYALSEAYLLIYPNTYPETFCISVMESQAAGTPVVTSAKGALTETIEDKKTGVCLQGDPYSAEYQAQFIKEVVELLKDNEKWQKYSEMGRKRAFENYSWEMIAGEWIETFNNLIIQYYNLINFHDFLQKIIDSYILSKEEKAIFYQLFDLMTKNFEFTRLKIKQKTLFEYFKN